MTGSSSELSPAEQFSLDFVAELERLLSIDLSTTETLDLLQQFARSRGYFFEGSGAVIGLGAETSFYDYNTYYDTLTEDWYAEVGIKLRPSDDDVRDGYGKRKSGFRSGSSKLFIYNIDEGIFETGKRTEIGYSSSLFAGISLYVQTTSQAALSIGIDASNLLSLAKRRLLIPATGGYNFVFVNLDNIMDMYRSIYAPSIAIHGEDWYENEIVSVLNSSQGIHTPHRQLGINGLISRFLDTGETGFDFVEEEIGALDTEQIRYTVHAIDDDGQYFHITTIASLEQFDPVFGTRIQRTSGIYSREGVLIRGWSATKTSGGFGASGEAKPEPTVSSNWNGLIGDESNETPIASSEFTDEQSLHRYDNFVRGQERLLNTFIEHPEWIPFADVIDSAQRTLLNLPTFNIVGELGNEPSFFSGDIRSTMLGQIGTALGQLIASGGDGEGGAELINNSADFTTLFASSNASSTLHANPAGFLSSLLAAEMLDAISRAIGIDGDSYGSQLLQEHIGTILDRVVVEPLADVVLDVFEKIGFNLPSADPLAVFWGSKLASQIVSPQTEAAAILSSVGSVVGASGGAKIGAALLAKETAGLGAQIGNAILPVIGAVIGAVIGTLIGNLIGKRKPKIPSADASTALNFTDGYYQLGAVNSVNNGNEDFVTDMAQSAASGLNGYINVILGANPNARVINTVSPTQVYGHTGNQVWVEIDGQRQDVDTGNEAVDIGTMYALKHTQIAGGNLYMKRAAEQSNASDLITLGGDLQVAENFALYKRHQNIIDGVIASPYESLSDEDKSWYNANETVLLNIQRSGHDPLSNSDQAWYDSNLDRVAGVLNTLNSVSTFSAGWIVTLARVTELGLNKSAASDFYGGAKGFVDSLQGVTSLPLGYEDVTFNLDGQDLQVYRDVDQDGVIDADETMAFNERGFLNAIGHEDGGVGYNHVSTNNAMTTANDVAIGVSGTFDDLTEQMVTSYTTVNEPGLPPYQEPSTSMQTLEGGNDIIVGDDGVNSLYGRSGDDWLDGGAGDGRDWLYGGDDNDVLLGRGGNDHLRGQDGDDVLIGGGGRDYLRGGAGDDILVQSGLNGWAYGDAGDDTIIVAQNSADSTTNFIGHIRGGAETEDGGNDTISFERFDQGIAVDMRYRPESWDTHTTAFFNHSDVRLYQIQSMDGSNTNLNFLYAAQIDNLTGTAFADALDGDDADNILRGGGGDDVLRGNGGSDTLEGGAGADTLVQTQNSAGTLGVTTVSYEHSLGGVDVSIQSFAADHENADILGTQHAFGADASGDVFVGDMQHLSGSAYSDVLEGNHLDNDLRGFDGDDYFIATSGADSIHGGEGFDTVDYGNHLGSSGLVINAYNGGGTSGYVNGVHATVGSDTLYGVEHVVGTQHADTITFGDGDNVLEGGGGNDTLYGGAGNDVYFVELGGGHDQIHEYGDQGHDTIMVGYDETLSWDDITILGGTNLEIRVPGQTLATAHNSPNANREAVGVDALDIGGTGGVDIWYLTGGADAGLGSAIGTNGNDTLRGYSDGRGNSLLQGFDGDDVIYGAGNNIGYSALDNHNNFYHGGRGNDTIYASTGDDQYIFDRGSGQDTVTDTGGLDHIQFGPGVASEDLIFEVVGNDLYIGITPQGASNTSDLRARDMDDYIQIVNGALTSSVLLGAINGPLNHRNLIEYITVQNVNIDLRTLDIDWVHTDIDPEPLGPNTNLFYPVMFDLDGDGLEMVSINESHIVIRGDNRELTRLGWLGADDGFLALDRDGDGKITSLSEISFVDDLEGATTDLEGLRAYDSNLDGVFDASDDRWGEFTIWRDLNQNGQGSRHEQMSLEEAGITSINLTLQSTGNNAGDYADNVVLNTAQYTTADGLSHTAYDVALAGSVIREGIESNAITTGSYGGALTDRLGRISISRIEKLLERLAADPQPDTGTGTPVVIDLNGDGELDLNHLDESGVLIDVDGNGVADRVGWVGAADGMLALDRNGDGVITAFDEISFVDDFEGAQTDLEGLRGFDSNRDGVFDASDERFSEFVIWQDLNQDGLSQDGEIRSLTDWGLTSITLTALESGRTSFGGYLDNVLFGETAITWSDGRTGIAGDVGLRVAYEGLEGLTGEGAPQFLTNFAGLEHIHVDAMAQFATVATQSAWGRIAGHRSPLMASLYAAEAELARIDRLGTDTGFTQDELLEQFENDGESEAGTDSSEEGEVSVTIPDPTLEPVEVQEPEGISKPQFDGPDITHSRELTILSDAFVGQSGLGSLVDVNNVGSSLGQITAQEVASDIALTKVEAAKVDVMKQAIAGFGETGFGAMSGLINTLSENQNILAVKQPLFNRSSF